MRGKRPTWRLVAHFAGPNGNTVDLVQMHSGTTGKGLHYFMRVPGNRVFLHLKKEDQNDRGAIKHVETSGILADTEVWEKHVL